MKRTISIWLVVLAMSAPMVAQLMASHAPTTAAQPSAIAPPQGKPVARVNGSVLTDADLVREEYAIFPYARQHNGLPKELEPQIRSGAMKMIIFEELVYQEALRRKMTVPVSEMRRAETEFRSQFNTPDEFQALMQNEFHGSEQLMREKIRRSLLIEALLKSEIDNKSAVSLAEARAYYEKNPARFQHQESFTFQTISILPPDKATPQQLQEGRKRAQDALKQAKATKTAEDFGLLAEKISDDDYRVMMGQHRPVDRDKLAPQVLQALATMKPGNVSDLIQIDQAYTIVRLNAHTPAGKTKFEDVKAQLEKELQQKKTNDLRSALDKRLRQGAKIEEL
ncbi:MAG TPA: peptidyl-prolyl cis-trans isomerase [Verrucomicrobiae bacterium]|nr:peptidyl-prolyl cis-trans isomerase [Verrucomicrobiae bacterium]